MSRATTRRDRRRRRAKEYAVWRIDWWREVGLPSAREAEALLKRAARAAGDALYLRAIDFRRSRERREEQFTHEGGGK